MINIGRYFGFLADVGGYLVLVEFSGIVKLVKSSGFLIYRVDISGNLRLNRFFKFWFRVKVVYYRVFLLAMGGSK